MPIIRTEARRLYRCDCCGKTDVWDANWAWHGSYKQLEDDGLRDVKPVITICSAECRIKLVAAGTIPHEGIDDHGNVIDDNPDDRPPSRKRRSSQLSQHQRVSENG